MDVRLNRAPRVVGEGPGARGLYQGRWGVYARGERPLLRHHHEHTPQSALEASCTVQEQVRQRLPEKAGAVYGRLRLNETLHLVRVSETPPQIQSCPEDISAADPRCLAPAAPRRAFRSHTPRTCATATLRTRANCLCSPVARVSRGAICQVPDAALTHGVWASRGDNRRG